MSELAPINTPAEGLKISPEALEVANCYLQEQNITAVAESLGLPLEDVAEIMDRDEVRSYVRAVFYDAGYNNRFLVRRAMDALIKQKFMELEEAGIGSKLDIAELLQMSHKMTMDYLDKEIALEKMRQGAGFRNQVNVQVNDHGGTNYQALLEKLISAGK